MTLPRRTLLPCFLSASMLLATGPSCKKDEPAPADSTPDAKAAETKADESKADDTKGDQGGKAPEEPPSTPIAANADGAPTYPAQLDALLDLVPADQDSFVVVRDPARVVAALGSFTGTQSESIAKQMKGMGMDNAEVVGTALAGISGAFEGTPIELDKGIVILPNVGSGLLLYASNEPDALPKAIEKLAPEAAKAKCEALSTAEGFVACTGADGEIPKDFTPGKEASKKRETMTAGLVGLDLERAVVAGRIETPDGKFLSMSIEPSGGQVVLNVSAPAMNELANQIGPGKPQLMGMVGADSGFVWAHAAQSGMEQMRKNVPPMAAGAVASLSGEATLGFGDAGGLMLAMSVNDPVPLRSAIELASGQLEQVPPKLPDGTKIKAERKELTVGKETLAALYVEMSDSPELAPLEQAGFEPNVHALVTQDYAALFAGVAEDVVTKYASYEVAPPPAELVKNLPPALANDLSAETVSMVVHIPLDGVSTDGFSELAGELAKGPAAGSKEAKNFMDAFVTQLAPLSSLSIWSRHDGDTVTFRVAVQPFGDYATEEGKRANEAVTQFLSGKSAKEVFGELATAYPDSPRARSYAIRRGDQNAGALSGVAIVGVMAAIAIPAFVKYIERSKAALEAVEPVPAAP